MKNTSIVMKVILNVIKREVREIFFIIIFFGGLSVILLVTAFLFMTLLSLLFENPIYFVIIVLIFILLFAFIANVKEEYDKIKIKEGYEKEINDN